MNKEICLPISQYRPALYKFAYLFKICSRYEVDRPNDKVAIDTNVKKYGCKFHNVGHSDLIFAKLLYGT